jgi:hypothetical protein
MKRLFLFLTIVLLASACIQQEICDYSAAYKLPKRVIDIEVSGNHLNTVQGFNFPYEFDSGTWPTGWSTYNYGTLQEDLDNYLIEGTADVYIDSLDGTLYIDLIGTTEVFDNMEIDADGDTLFIAFIDNCF